jgi:hypothetical protein
MVWLLYKSVELNINEIPLDLQHVHCWEGETFSSNVSFWLSSPLLLMQYSKIQPKKSNAKNRKDKRVFFWGWMVHSTWTNFWYMMGGWAVWVITLILHQFVDFFTLQMGASTLTYLYLATMASVILCVFAKLASSPGTGPFGLSLSYSSLTYLIWTCRAGCAHYVCCYSFLPLLQGMGKVEQYQQLKRPFLLQDILTTQYSSTQKLLTSEKAVLWIERWLVTTYRRSFPSLKMDFDSGPKQLQFPQAGGSKTVLLTVLFTSTLLDLNW